MRSARSESVVAHAARSKASSLNSWQRRNRVSNGNEDKVSGVKFMPHPNHDLVCILASLARLKSFNIVRIVPNFRLANGPSFVLIFLGAALDLSRFEASPLPEGRPTFFGGLKPGAQRCSSICWTRAFLWARNRLANIHIHL
jgi:hypothetical protein